jgi:hypothetical protein
MTATTEIQMVPVNAITVLNPRARNRRVFHELITSIAHLGLKKPTRSADENKLLPGNQVLAIRRIILQRNQRRNKLTEAVAPRTPEALHPGRVLGRTASLAKSPAPRAGLFLRR